MTRWCIRCGEPHTDDSPVCSWCEYADPPDEPVCIGCDKPFENGWCPRCEEWEPLSELKRTGTGGWL